MKISIPSNGQGNHFATGGPGRAPGLSEQLRLRIERVARMRVAGLKDADIQSREGITAPAFHYLVNLDEYKVRQDEILKENLSKMDNVLAGNVEALRNEIRNSVPSALRTIIEVANQRKDLKTALAASLELLDRDPDRVAQKCKPSEIPVDGYRLPDNVIDVVSKEADKVATEINNSKRLQ